MPDARGRQTALAWIAAGAALADVPATPRRESLLRSARRRRGWQRAGSRRARRASPTRSREAIGRATLPERGIAAPDWVTAKDNPFNLDEFLDQYGKAVSATTPGERSRHMAAALVAAGAILHVLGDLGAPSRVRGDEAAHLEPLGGGPDDLGSRFERIAALAYGRLGVPAPSRVITRTRLRDYFSRQRRRRPRRLDRALVLLAEHAAAVDARRRRDAAHASRARSPRCPTRLNLMAASRDDGTTLRDANGTCLARYKVEHGVVEF